MYLVVIAIISAIFVGSLILFRPIYFKLVNNTVGLLDQMLDTVSEETEKQQALTKKLFGVLISLVTALGSLILILGLIYGILLLYTYVEGVGISQLEYNSAPVIIAMLIGSFLPIIPLWFKKSTADYGEIAILIHRLLLDNRNLALSLFSIEKKFFNKKIKLASTLHNPESFVIVTGLARAGTTAMTTLLHESGKFHSLSYADMPFLLAPNIWRSMNGKPAKKKKELKERSHKDGVLFGVDSVEALEEFFWRSKLHDNYIEEDKLISHEVGDKVYQDYITYQSLVKGSGEDQTRYLSKNNNFLLRYNSLRTLNKEFKVILMFRDPINHSISLFKQHQSYSEMQTDDEFVKDYMSWLVHHEFGLEQRNFHFENHHTESQYTDKNDLSYWIEQWCNYYSFALSVDHSNMVFIEYNDFLNEPQGTIEQLGRFLDLDLSSLNPNKFEKKTNSQSPNLPQDLLEKSQKIFIKLQELKSTHLN